MKKILSFAFLLLFALQNVGIAAGYTGKSNIAGFSSLSGTGTFELYGSWGNVDNCTNAGKFIVGAHVIDTEMSQKAKYSAVLAAFMAGKTIELYVDGCTSGNQPIVKGIYLPERNP